ncbi:UDP-2,4-diacetamido-2,4,6-trideoxy-beta-L-altropyranose hydrolase [Roseobacter sp. HKCCD7870]|uniref:UDP-2,4-diacetamido-2,4, 6-trideoxy-beta-L-altropyranose hydrolase n=1 Tax=Roseobacter sp. HKCCD7870 TaxID=3120343 RepID=UPI0030EC9637
MKKAVFRVDASSEIGGGHVGRCLALGAALSAIGWSVVFASRPGTATAAPLLVESGLQIIDLDCAVEPFAEAEKIITSLGERPHLLVVDHYGLGAEYENAFRRVAGLVAAIDDVPGERPHLVDILIDGTPGRQGHDWSPHVPKAALILAGTRYALVRASVVDMRQEALSRLRRNEVRKVTIFFGMADKQKATLTAMLATRAAFPQAQMDVIAGAAVRHLAEIKTVAGAVGASVSVSPSDYLDRLVASDLAFGAGGVAAIERACLGVPSIAIETAMNQKQVIEALEISGALINAGPIKQMNEERMVPILKEAAQELNRISKCAAATIDGLGARRAAQVLSQYVEKAV